MQRSQRLTRDKLTTSISIDFKENSLCLKHKHFVNNLNNFCLYKELNIKTRYGSMSLSHCRHVTNLRKGRLASRRRASKRNFSLSQYATMQERNILELISSPHAANKSRQQVNFSK